MSSLDITCKKRKSLLFPEFSFPSLSILYPHLFPLPHFPSFFSRPPYSFSFFFFPIPVSYFLFFFLSPSPLFLLLPPLSLRKVNSLSFLVIVMVKWMFLAIFLLHFVNFCSSFFSFSFFFFFLFWLFLSFRCFFIFLLLSCLV